jgi:hypothetical protein
LPWLGFKFKGKVRKPPLFWKYPAFYLPIEDIHLIFTGLLGKHTPMRNKNKSDQNNPKKGKQKADEKANDKAGRLAEALRANLRKRKTQAKTRVQDD